MILLLLENGHLKTLMMPDEASQKRAAKRAIVDFPQPECPTRAVISPCFAVKLIPLTVSSSVLFAVLSAIELSTFLLWSGERLFGTQGGDDG